MTSNSNWANTWSALTHTQITDQSGILTGDPEYDKHHSDYNKKIAIIEKMKDVN